MRADDVQAVVAEEEASPEEEEGKGDGEPAGDDLTERGGSGDSGGRPEGDINLHGGGVYAREAYGRLEAAAVAAGTSTASAQR